MTLLWEIWPTQEKRPKDTNIRVSLLEWPSQTISHQSRHQISPTHVLGDPSRALMLCSKIWLDNQRSLDNWGKPSKIKMGTKTSKQQKQTNEQNSPTTWRNKPYEKTLTNIIHIPRESIHEGRIGCYKKTQGNKRQFLEVKNTIAEMVNSLEGLEKKVVDISWKVEQKGRSDGKKRKDKTRTIEWMK